MKMKMKSRYVVATITLGCLITSANASQIIQLDLSGRDNAGLGTGESGATFVGPSKTFDQVSDFSLNDVAWADGAYSGVVDISLVGTVSDIVGGDTIGRGGKGAFGINNSGTQTATWYGVIQPTEGTLTLSSLLFTYVSGDALSTIDSIQFAGVYIGNWKTASAGTLNGQAITGGNSGGDLAGGQNVLSTFADSVGVECTVDRLSINGVDLQVTAIPEPASLGLIAVFCGGILFIRRRFMI